MSQGPERREPRRFEPPPWEREQFERLERDRRRDEPTAEQVPRKRPEQAPAADRPSAPEAREVSTGPEPEGVDAMLLALKAEEPSIGQGAWAFGIAAAAFVGAIGVALVIWGAVALARSVGTGPAGIMGALIMSVMGGLFVALAMWMGVRSLKQRGVL